MAFDRLNVGEDFSMIDDDGRIRPDIERPPVVGFRAHAERIIRRWLTALGYLWYANDYGAGLLDLINSPCTVAQLTSKAQELRQQAMAETGTTQARVELKKQDDTIVIESTISVQGFAYSVSVNLNSSDIAVTILGVT